MSIPHEELAEILEVMIELYRKLSGLAAEKEEILIAGDVENLVELSERERKLIAELEGLESQRQEVVGEAAETLDLGEKEPSLSRLLPEMEDAAAEKQLRKLRGRLLEIIDELGEANERNEALLRESLAYNEFFVSLLTELEKAGFTYGRDGSRGERDGRSFMDSKV